MKRSNKPGLWASINKPIFFPPAILIVIFTFIGIAFPEAFGRAANAAFNFCVTKFDWLYVIGSFGLIVFCLWAAFSKYGKIVLGGKDAKPEMSFFTWFCIALTSGIATGIVFYGTADPLAFFANPPAYLGVQGGTVEAAEKALRPALLHWAIHPYAIYTAAAVSFAFIILNGKRPFAISSSLYPLLGNKTQKATGWAVDALSLFALIGGVGTSLGIGCMQLTSGLKYTFGTDFPLNTLNIIFIASFALIYILSACSGLHKGIKYISKTNIYIYFILMFWVLITCDPFHIIRYTTTCIGDYLQNFINLSLYMEPMVRTGFVSHTTIFYYAWFFAYAPCVGLFLIKLAKGRTIRQFVIVNLIAPAFFCLVWFGFFGGGAISVELFGEGGILQDISKYGVAVSLFSFLKHLPLSGVTTLLGFLAIIFSFITLAESMTLTLADMTSNVDTSTNEQASPNILKIFWGTGMALMAYILLLSGGLQALQTSVIVCGLPILIIQIFMCIAYIKSVVHQADYDMTLTEEEKVALRNKNKKDNPLNQESVPLQTQ